MHKAFKQELATVTDENRPFIIEWLRDRSAFHSWSSSLVTGSFIVITVFGNKPSMMSYGGLWRWFANNRHSPDAARSLMQPNLRLVHPELEI